MRIHAVHIQIEEGDSIRIVEGTEGQPPLVVVGEALIGFDSVESAERLADAAFGAAVKMREANPGSL